MKGTITNVVIGEEQRVAQVVGPGNFSAFINLKNLEEGDEVAFWLEYDIEGTNDPQAAASDAVVITFDDIAEGGQIVSAWQFEPLVLEEGQVAQIAFVQTDGLPRDFGYRNTNIATAQ